MKNIVIRGRKEKMFVVALVAGATAFQVLQSPAFMIENYLAMVTGLHLVSLLVVAGMSMLLDGFLFQHRFSCRFMQVAMIRLVTQVTTALLLSMAAALIYHWLMPGNNGALTFWSSFLFYAFAFFATTMIMEVSRLAGKGATDKLILGKYHLPKKEKRIFLFIDLTESTRLSKLLPLEDYSLLIREFFRDIDSVMEAYEGSIYQYAGDQVIVSWEAKGGNYRKAVQSFIEFFNLMKTRRPYYVKRYGTMAGFKAAIHAGTVVGTWVGRQKRELVFQGDVLNIAARITSLAKNLSYPVMITNEVRQHISQPLHQRIIDAGYYSVKGVDEPIGLHFIDLTSREWRQERVNAGRSVSAA